MISVFTKIKAILGSIRFWTVTLGFAAAFFSSVESDGFSYALLFESIRNWALVVAGVGTLDKTVKTINQPKV